MSKKLQKIIYTFFWLPFVFSFIGYYCMDGGAAGEKLTVVESIYASIALYYINPVADNQNAFIIVGKYLSFIVTTSILFSVISFFVGSFSKWWIRRFKDSVAVYTDSPLGTTLCESCKHGYLAEVDMTEKLELEGTKNHILLFSDDNKALQLLNSVKDTCKDNIYVLFNDLDTTLLATGKPNIHLFNINDILARRFWRDNNLYELINGEYSGKTYKVGIAGFDALGKAILKHAYMGNLYDLNQSIEYHVWGANSYDRKFFESLNCGNKDKIIMHETKCLEDISTVVEMNCMVVTQEDTINTLQSLLGEKSDLKIFVPSSTGVNYSEVFGNENIISYGDVSSILNEKNIKAEKTYYLAKLFNYDYYVSANNIQVSNDFEKDMNDQWNELSGLNRKSSVARADFYWIEKKKKDQGAKEEEVWEMEHIRWCRFYYLNHFKYGPVKDPKLKTHPLLIPFAELPQSEKVKDGIGNTVLKEIIESNL